MKPAKGNPLPGYPDGSQVINKQTVEGTTDGYYVIEREIKLPSGEIFVDQIFSS